eukprot:6205769-Pleurochrysis_carterae.AAC.3
MHRRVHASKNARIPRGHASTHARATRRALRRAALGAQVQAAAELSHVSDVRALIREMELKARARQGLPPPTPQETALCESLDVLDATVRTNGAWDDARPQLADALMRAGMPATAEIAALSS